MAIIHLAIMKGKRKAKTVPRTSVGFYQQNAAKLYRFEGAAEEARKAIANGTLKPSWENGQAVGRSTLYPNCESAIKAGMAWIESKPPGYCQIQVRTPTQWYDVDYKGVIRMVVGPALLSMETYHPDSIHAGHVAKLEEDSSKVTMVGRLHLRTWKVVGELYFDDGT